MPGVRRVEGDECMTQTKMNDEDFESTASVRAEVRWVRFALTAAGLILGSWLAITKLRATPVVPMSDQIWTQFFTDLIIVLYYFTWIGGSILDMNAQQDVIRRLERSSAEIRGAAIAFIVLLGGLFYFLRTASNLTSFILVYAVILVLDVGAWFFYLRRILEPQFANSRSIALKRGNPISALEVDVIWEFMRGRWRLWRWGYSFVGLTVIWLAAWAGLPTSWAPFAPMVSMFSTDSFFAFLILMYLVILEAWIWAFRICRGARRSQLRKFGRQYKVIVLESQSNHILKMDRANRLISKEEGRER